MEFSVSLKAGRALMHRDSRYDVVLRFTDGSDPKVTLHVARKKDWPMEGAAMESPFSSISMLYSMRGRDFDAYSHVKFAKGLQSSLVDQLVNGNDCFKPIELMKFFLPLCEKAGSGSSASDRLSEVFSLTFFYEKDGGWSDPNQRWLVTIPHEKWTTALSIEAIAQLAGVTLGTHSSLQEPLRKFYKGTDGYSTMYYDSMFFIEFYAASGAWRTLRSSDYNGIITGPIRHEPAVFWHCGMDEVDTSFIVTCGAGDEYMDDSDFSTEEPPPNRRAFYRMSAPCTTTKDLGITTGFQNECPYTSSTFFARGWAKRGDLEKWVTKQFGASHGWYKHFCHALQLDHAIEDVRKWSTGSAVRVNQDPNAYYNAQISLGFALVLMHASFTRHVTSASTWTAQLRSKHSVFATWAALAAHFDKTIAVSQAAQNYTCGMIAASDVSGLIGLYGLEMLNGEDSRAEIKPVVITEDEAEQAEVKLPKKTTQTRSLDLIYAKEAHADTSTVCWWDVAFMAPHAFTQYQYVDNGLAEVEATGYDFIIKASEPCHYQDVNVGGYGGGWDKTDGTFATQNKNIYVTGLSFDVIESNKTYKHHRLSFIDETARLYSDALIWDGEVCPLSRFVPVTTSETAECGQGFTGYGMPVVFTADNSDGTSIAEFAGRSNTQHYQWRATIIF